jgi:hypothetical protein
MAEFYRMGESARETLLEGMMGINHKEKELKDVLASPSRNANTTVLEDIVQAFVEGLINDVNIIVNPTIELEEQ